MPAGVWIAIHMHTAKKYTLAQIRTAEQRVATVSGKGPEVFHLLPNTVRLMCIHIDVRETACCPLSERVHCRHPTIWIKATTTQGTTLNQPAR